MDIVLIKIAWLFMLLLVIATFAQQEKEQEQQQQQNGLSKETSSTSSFAEPLSNIPDPTSSKSGLQGEFQKAKLGLDAFKVGKQQADHIKDKIPNVGYS